MTISPRSRLPWARKKRPYGHLRLETPHPCKHLIFTATVPGHLAIIMDGTIAGRAGGYPGVAGHQSGRRGGARDRVGLRIRGSGTSPYLRSPVKTGVVPGQKCGHC
ncbi:MAG: hypothetical protein CM15mP92_1810 [Halieaceae bacterium]|nr:MAG: hypothetical protein CM15mP92_1810 [Halieaceae bacterium]